MTDKDVKTRTYQKVCQYRSQGCRRENVKLITLSIYLPDKDIWQGVRVTDRADIDALLKNAVNIDAMNLYGSNAMAYGIMQQFARSSVCLTYTDEKGDEWNASAGYTEEDYPEDIIEKYRAQAEKDAETASGLYRTVMLPIRRKWLSDEKARYHRHAASAGVSCRRGTVHRCPRWRRYSSAGCRSQDWSSFRSRI